MKYLLLALALLLSAPAIAVDAYAQLSSGMNQTDQDVKVELIDAIKDMEYDPVTGLEVRHKGAYFVVLAPQVGPFQGCSNFWLSVNDTFVANSNVRICQGTPESTDVIVSQGVLELEKGDRLQFKQSGNLGIVAVSPPGEPLIPSVIISVFKL